MSAFTPGHVRLELYKILRAHHQPISSCQAKVDNSQILVCQSWKLDSSDSSVHFAAHSSFSRGSMFIKLAYPESSWWWPAFSTFRRVPLLQEVLFSIIMKQSKKNTSHTHTLPHKLHDTGAAEVAELWRWNGNWAIARGWQTLSPYPNTNMGSV